VNIHGGREGEEPGSPVTVKVVRVRLASRRLDPGPPSTPGGWSGPAFRRGTRAGTALPPERRAALLDSHDPLLRVQPEVAVGDHAGGLLEGRLGLLDQLRGSASGAA
jgi:hypothetical protein